ncbi:MAG TPA: BON domain-containing protein [Actinomycetes bacterium]|jgi:osmotically-inducible protein OsmY|nr:BON domain-containing protein [Actinomycetes bacterium]
MARPAGEAPEYSAAHVQDLLARDPRVGELELDVEVSGGTVVITGVVHTQQRRDAVTTVVREALPGMEVDNRLEVADTGAGPAVERLP